MSLDTSKITQPIELGLPTIIQILDARKTATKEVLDYLEQECDAVLECRYCRGLFRSLANFIAHKRVYCMNSHKDERTTPSFYPNPAVTTILPTDPDTDKLVARPSRRRTTTGKRKARPIRKTAPADLSKIKEKPAVDIIIKPMEGVTCAVAQTVVGAETEAQSLTNTNDENKTVMITAVQPKDGYPNMNLRQRPSKPAATFESEWEDIEALDTPKGNGKSKNLTSKVALAEVLSKRTDCDFTKMKCLPCNTSFGTAKALNFHMISKHGKKRNLYPCIFCKNVFTQFWGVTRHLKTAHGLTGDTIDKAREAIRARVYSESVNSSKGETSKAASPNNTPAKKKASPAAEDRASKSSLHCNLCTKTFGKRQYLYLHMVACYKKSGLEPPPFKKQEIEEKASKPLLFVCKTCNRAFSMRQNMVMHAVACGKRRKEDSPAEAGNSSTPDATAGPSAPAIASTSSQDPSAQPEATTVTVTGSPDNSIQSTNDSTASGETSDRTNAKSAAPSNLIQDDMLGQLSPSDEAKEEERNQTPPVTPTSLALGRPKRNLKPKQFSDGTISVRRKVPEVVRIQQADGSQVYKLRQDVEVTAPAAAQPPLANILQPETLIQPDDKSAQATPPVQGTNSEDDIVKAKDSKGIRILIQGESVPLLDEDDEAKIAGMIDISKLVCLKCKRQYGSSSNLRRHAVRHLGWRRFKCKLCKFTSYNKSECKSHLRKCHSSEVATLLDGGLSPYIIDLGALLDESCEEGGGKLNLTVPTTSENGRVTPPNGKARNRSKEPVAADGQATEEDSTTSAGRRKSGRTRKQNESPDDTKVSLDNSNSASLSRSADDVSGRPRARARKQELKVMTDGLNERADSINKRIHNDVEVIIRESDEEEPISPKLPRLLDLMPVEHKEPVRRLSTGRLEGLINKLKSRQSLSPEVTPNSSPIFPIVQTPEPAAKEVVEEIKCDPSSPPLNIPTTVTEVIKADN